MFGGAGAAAMAIMAGASVAGVGLAIKQGEDSKAANAAAIAAQKEALKRQQEQERINLYIGIAGLVISVASILVIFYLYRRQ